MGKVALLLGATGETGGEILQLLLDNDAYSKVIILVRREQAPGEGWQKVEQAVVDFDNLEQHKQIFEGVDVAFCCLGYRGGLVYAVKLARFSPPDEPVRKVDHAYVVSAARLLKAGGCHQFIFLSAYGSNAESALVYLEAKGRAEKDLAELGFHRFVSFRPNILVNKRDSSKWGEDFIKWIAKKTDSSYSWSITNKMLAQAMVSQGENSQTGENNSHETYLEHSDIVKIALSL